MLFRPPSRGSGQGGGSQLIVKNKSRSGSRTVSPGSNDGSTSRNEDQKVRLKKVRSYTFQNLLINF